MKTRTARSLARHGTGDKDWSVLSPYSGRRLRIVGATEHGNKVRLLLETGVEMEVDAMTKVEVGK